MRRIALWSARLGFGPGGSASFRVSFKRAAMAGWESAGEFVAGPVPVAVARRVACAVPVGAGPSASSRPCFKRAATVRCLSRRELVAGPVLTAGACAVPVTVVRSVPVASGVSSAGSSAESSRIAVVVIVLSPPSRNSGSSRLDCCRCLHCRASYLMPNARLSGSTPASSSSFPGRHRRRCRTSPTVPYWPVVSPQVVSSTFGTSTGAIAQGREAVVALRFCSAAD